LLYRFFVGLVVVIIVSNVWTDG